MLATDAHTERARAWLVRQTEGVTLSDWTLAELTSALAIAQRVGRLGAVERTAAERAADAWADRRDGVLPVLSEDVRRARSLMKTTASPLRAGDALHLAIALREGIALASFDLGLKRAAADLGLPIEDL